MQTNEPPIQDEQIEIIRAALMLVIESPAGEGTVTLTVRRRKMVYVSPAPSLNTDQHYNDETRRWLEWDRWERRT